MTTGSMTTRSVNAPRVLYHMVRADFLERVRRYSFLITLAGALYLAYAVVTEKISIIVGDNYRGVYNSAWVGVLMSVTCSTFLTLAAFYIVKNAVQRDTDTRVGQILAATPMRKDFYTLAKTLSNFAVLACMVGILMLAAVAMQLIRSGPNSFSLWKLWAPFIFLALPALLLTASLALLFETVPILRGGVGNVVYFFLWTAALAIAATKHDDPAGLSLLSNSTRTALHPIDPSHPDDFHFGVIIGNDHPLRTFLWNGIDWTPHVLLARLFWVGVAAGIVFLASLFFHRFDPARSWRRSGKQPAPAAAIAESEERMPAPVAISAAHLTSLDRNSTHWRFPQLVNSELRLMLKGHRWWYPVAAGLLIGQLVSPQPAVRSGFLLVAWIWPILIWSKMGCREARHATGTLLFSCERNLSRQLPALWTAGVLVTLLTGGGAGIRLLLSADWHGLAGWLAGAIFIPSLALALGVWTGGSIAFEALYTVWWYVGPAHQMPGLDFMATTPASSSPATYALAAVALLAVSYWGRRTRLGYA